jgi:thiosulfate/3-mercaptopyruvate sulfurtransferase
LTVAEYKHPEALATTEWLAAHLDDPSVRVVDLRYYVQMASGGSFRGVSGKEAYHQGHIPGALFVDPVSGLSDPEDPLSILSADRFEVLMGRLGIGNGSTVVVYDDSGGTWAVRQAIERRDVCIVDALPEVFYSGKARLYATHRAGHIPTALNVPATANVDHVTQTLLTADELARLWRNAGLKPDQRVITYCGAGVYGAYDLFVLYVLGHEKVSLYDASWMEWGANPEMPVETGSGDKISDSD